VNRLLYRSRQRGFLEMDLLVGLFAERRLPLMAERVLAAFSAVLDQENPDLFKWLTGQEPAPDAMLANATFVVRPARRLAGGTRFEVCKIKAACTLNRPLCQALPDNIAPPLN